MGAAGLTKLGQLLPQDQARPTIPTLAAHGHELHLLASQEKGDENIVDGRLHQGSTETLLEPFQMLRSLNLSVGVRNDSRSLYVEKTFDDCP